MSDHEVIAAIRQQHLKANIDDDPPLSGFHWDEAWLDPGGSIFGPGPYVKLPVDRRVDYVGDETERVVIRVYPPARLRQRLQKAWRPDR